MLLDTCVLIDYLRGRPGAVQFLEGLVHAPAISSATVAELYAGIRDAKERQSLNALIEVIIVYDMNVPIAEKAGEIMVRYRASHGLDLIDAMIAATAQVHSLEMVTLKLKHFPMFPSLNRPY